MKMYLGVYLIVFGQILCSCQRAEPETYLIPDDYVGRVQIIFNQNGRPYTYKNQYNRDTIYTPKIGRDIKYEGRRRVYEIPSDGILLTQFKENDGFTNREYYSVDSSGNRILLEVYKFEYIKKDSAGYEVVNKNKRGIFGDGTTGSIGNEHICFQEFIVSSYNQLDSFRVEDATEQFDLKVKNLLALPESP